MTPRYPADFDFPCAWDWHLFYRERYGRKNAQDPSTNALEALSVKQRHEVEEEEKR